MQEVCGTALPQGRTPNLGHNYTAADVAPLFPRAAGAARGYTYTLAFEIIII